MYIHEYGTPSDPTIILLGPMMVSGENLYNLMSPYFKEHWHVIAPDQGAHGRAGNYISADREYSELKAFLKEHGYTSIRLVYGASLGAAVGYRLFTDPGFTVEHAWFDGVALTENARFPEWFMKRMFRSRKKSLAKSHAEASPSLVKMYGYEFAKMMTANFARMTEADIDAICHACCHYDLFPLSDEQQKKLHLDFGEKDYDYIYSKKTIPLYMPHAEVTIRPGYAHCGYMAANAEAYVHQIEAFIE